VHVTEKFLQSSDSIYMYIVHTTVRFQILKQFANCSTEDKLVSQLQTWLGVHMVRKQACANLQDGLTIQGEKMKYKQCDTPIVLKA